MSDQAEETVVRPTVAGRVLWAFVYLVAAYFLFFAVLLTDYFLFDGDLVCHPVFTRFPEWENAIGEGIGIVYWPLIKPLEALGIL